MHVVDAASGWTGAGKEGLLPPPGPPCRRETRLLQTHSGTGEFAAGDRCRTTKIPCAGQSPVATYVSYVCAVLRAAPAFCYAYRWARLDSTVRQPAAGRRQAGMAVAMSLGPRSGADGRSRSAAVARLHIHTRQMPQAQPAPRPSQASNWLVTR